ncbi:hypothetical protein ABRY23_06040 [Melioribacteraceae bacterium 4301-Me]|uniref:hypothetical protein n=1 Tax=Pyranulibacter aquaticus TaxID=3163344 RepID=UPI00359907F4
MKNYKPVITGSIIIVLLFITYYNYKSSRNIANENKTYRIFRVDINDIKSRIREKNFILFYCNKNRLWWLY